MCAPGWCWRTKLRCRKSRLLNTFTNISQKGLACVCQTLKIVKHDEPSRFYKYIFTVTVQCSDTLCSTHGATQKANLTSCRTIIRKDLFTSTPAEQTAAQCMSCCISIKQLDDVSVSSEHLCVSKCSHRVAAVSFHMWSWAHLATGRHHLNLWGLFVSPRVSHWSTTPRSAQHIWLLLLKRCLKHFSAITEKEGHLIEHTAKCGFSCILGWGSSGCLRRAGACSPALLPHSELLWPRSC